MPDGRPELTGMNLGREENDQIFSRFLFTFFGLIHLCNKQNNISIKKKCFIKQVDY